MIERTDQTEQKHQGLILLVMVLENKTKRDDVQKEQNANPTESLENESVFRTRLDL